MRFSNRTLTVVAAVVLVGAAGGYWLFGRSASRGPIGPGGGTVVVGAPATLGDVALTFDAVGTLRANEAVTVTCKTTGIVKSIHFDEGQQVKAGQVLVELDDNEARANLAVAEAAKRDMDQQLQRSRALLAGQAVAQARVDQLLIQAQGAEAAVRAAQARLQDLSIRAPFGGVAGLRRVSPGALVRPADPVTTVDDVKTLKLDFTAPETVLRALQLGMSITARSVAFPDQRFEGKVAALDTRIDPVTRTVAIVAELDNPDFKLKPGMFMNVGLQVEQRQRVVLIPEEALVPVGDQQFVFVVSEKKATRRPVTIGARQANKVEVVGGLKEGEVVITRGTQKVRDGAPVQVQLEAGNGAPAARPET